MNHNKSGGGNIEEQYLIFLVLLPASICDLYQYRVPNFFVCVGFALGLYRNILDYGTIGIGYFLINSLIPFVVCFFFYLLHIIGAGDIKLFSVISSFFNFTFCFRVMIGSLFIGAVISILRMIQKRNFIQRFRYFFDYVRRLTIEKKICAYYDLEVNGDEGVIPFTICISMAVIVCLFLYK